MSEFIVKFSEDEDSDQTSIEKYMWLLVNPLFSLATWVFQDKMKQFCFLFFSVEAFCVIYMPNFVKHKTYRDPLVSY